MKNNIFLCVCVSIILSFYTVNCLKCYYCYSVVHDGCSIPMNVSVIKQKDCDADEVCLKLIGQKTINGEFTYRDCAPKSFNCSGVEGSPKECHLCLENLCNGDNPYSNSTTTASPVNSTTPVVSTSPASSTSQPNSSKKLTEGFVLVFSSIFIMSNFNNIFH
uniref:Putative 18.9 kDa midgut protein n=1 Tax=Nyssomyia neivai TaxID=330878 RepID=A0A1L8DR51_9DIPT